MRNNLKYVAPLAFVLALTTAFMTVAVVVLAPFILLGAALDLALLALHKVARWYCVQCGDNFSPERVIYQFVEVPVSQPPTVFADLGEFTATATVEVGVGPDEGGVGGNIQDCAAPQYPILWVEDRICEEAIPMVMAARLTEEPIKVKTKTPKTKKGKAGEKTSTLYLAHAQPNGKIVYKPYEGGPVPADYWLARKVGRKYERVEVAIGEVA